ncbi:hypothetical protein EI94DRAFT_1702752 [Lactarius quietus]|nr:hypothetical protein EI94DRAFT_1702752 [Lactarius quietus]
MSKRSSTASSSSSLDDIIEESLKKYEEETNKSLRPLIDELELDDKCDDKILALFRAQVKEFKEFASGDEKLMKSLKPIVKVLCASSSVIGAGVGLVFKPASVIFAGVDVLLSAAKDVIASHEALIEIFERMAYFFNRLEEYTGMPNVMAALKGVIVEIMTEVLKIFGIMTKEIKRGRARRLLKEFLKKLIGSDVIQDALNRLGDLTHEEVNTVIVQILKSTHRIEGGVDAARAELKVVSDNVVRVMKDGKDREAHEDEKKRSWFFDPASLGC